MPNKPFVIDNLVETNFPSGVGYSPHQGALAVKKEDNAIYSALIHNGDLLQFAALYPEREIIGAREDGLYMWVTYRKSETK